MTPMPYTQYVEQAKKDQPANCSLLITSVCIPEDFDVSQANIYADAVRENFLRALTAR